MSRTARGRGRKPPPGSGQRFSQLQGQLAKGGARNPAALAAYIGRQKYGKRGFAQLGAAGRRHRV